MCGQMRRRWQFLILPQITILDINSFILFYKITPPQKKTKLKILKRLKVKTKIPRSQIKKIH